jgi:site-specific recombinase XerC
VTGAGFDHERFAICVWRSVRVNGDTKTEKSRRTLELPDEAAAALKEHRARQAARRLEAGALWQDHGLVFCSQTGTPLDAHNVRRAFRGITKAAGMGKTWSPGMSGSLFGSQGRADYLKLVELRGFEPLTPSMRKTYRCSCCQ